MFYKRIIFSERSSIHQEINTFTCSEFTLDEKNINFFRYTRLQWLSEAQSVKFLLYLVMLGVNAFLTTTELSIGTLTLNHTGCSLVVMILSSYNFGKRSEVEGGVKTYVFLGPASSISACQDRQDLTSGRWKVGTSQNSTSRVQSRYFEHFQD
jgi:hypothetical protein